MKRPGLMLSLYRALSPLLVRSVPVAARFSPKLQQGVQGRRAIMERLLSQADRLRGGVWFHVTSVGEYEQARPVIEAVKAQHPGLPVAVTHFSPSGFDFAQKRPCADLHDYLPFDHPGDMKRLMAAWQPRLLVFVKFDLWPNLVLAADNQEVPLCLVAGSLAPSSARLHPMARPMYRDLFDRFAHLGVCTADDRRRFLDDLEVTCPVTVAGDTRVEQVILRYEAAEDGPIASHLKKLGGRLMILGSTWPPDENLWLPVLKELLTETPDLRLVLTPHEPAAERLEALEKELASQDIPRERLSRFLEQDAGPDHPARVILVDSIGHLAEIYRSGHLAYVGGSFTTGVHNTMEPAVARMPVLFGPRISNAEEAGVLVRRQAGWVVTRPEEALARARELLDNPQALATAGQKARQVVLDQRGATVRSMELIQPFLK
jgi:3-deoxy-D-manno-octulosonic-acid transferase